MLISNITPQLKVGGGGEGRTTTMTALFSHNGGFYGRRIRREYREPPNAKCNKKLVSLQEMCIIGIGQTGWAEKNEDVSTKRYSSDPSNSFPSLNSLSIIRTV